MKHTSTRNDNFVFDFEKVNVILGANGCGKSKLLTEIKDQANAITGGFKVAYIEGGRTIKIRDSLQVDHSNFSQFDRLDTARATYYSKRVTSLADRVFDALLVLDRRGAYIKSQHSDAVDIWLTEGRHGECPRRKQAPLDYLFELFSEIFPQIGLTYAPESKQLLAKKNGNVYGPSGMSDGEKQVFSILADLIELDDEHRLIVADEPELNLHPELAERVWTLIENEFPDKTFVYATHSISFALRSNVQRVWVLSSDSKHIVNFTKLNALPRDQTVAFLGALPGILSANRVLVTEGHEKSFDAIFYRWILQDEKIEIFACGNCLEVASVVQRAELWQQIATSIELKGVVDRDYRGDDYLASLETVAIHVLRYHEAEAYLCVPEVLCAIAARIGSQERVLSVEDVKDAIFSSLDNDQLAIAARRAFALSRVTLGVSVERKILAGATTQQQIAAHIRSAAEIELKKAESKLSPNEVEANFNKEVAAIQSILTARDVDLALRFLPAKELLNTLASRAGCKNSSDLMRSLRRNFKPTDFDVTKALAAELVLNETASK